MDFGKFTLCLTLTLTVTLTVSVKLDPPKPFGTKTIYDWSFTDEEMIGIYVSPSLHPISQPIQLHHNSLFRKLLHSNFNILKLMVASLENYSMLIWLYVDSYSINSCLKLMCHNWQHLLWLDFRTSQHCEFGVTILRLYREKKSLQALF